MHFDATRELRGGQGPARRTTSSPAATRRVHPTARRAGMKRTSRAAGTAWWTRSATWAPTAVAVSIVVLAATWPSTSTSSDRPIQRPRTVAHSTRPSPCIGRRPGCRGCRARPSHADAKVVRPLAADKLAVAFWIPLGAGRGPDGTRSGHSPAGGRSERAQTVAEPRAGAARRRINPPNWVKAFGEFPCNCPSHR
jgi:hypothetical protein